MAQSQESQGSVLVCHTSEIFAFGLASLLRESALFASVTAAINIAGIVEALEAGVDLVVLGAPCLGYLNPQVTKRISIGS